MPSHFEHNLNDRLARPGQRPVQTGSIVTDLFNDIRFEVEILEHRVQRVDLVAAGDQLERLGALIGEVEVLVRGQTKQAAALPPEERNL